MTGTGSNHPKPRLVEIVGLPGVGKSTLSGDLTDRLRSDGLAVKRIGLDEPWSMTTVMRSIRSGLPAAWSVLTELRPALHKGTLDLRRGLQLLALSPNVIRARYAGLDAVVMDEIGIFHFLQRFGLRATRPDFSLARIGGRSWIAGHLPDVLVLCGAEEGIRMERRRTRNSPDDARELNDPGLRSRLALNGRKVESEIASIADSLATFGRMETLRIDLSSDFDQTARLAQISAAVHVDHP